MKIIHSAKVDLNHDSTFADFLEVARLANVPAHAKLRVSHYAGDQREPSVTTIEFTWTVDSGELGNSGGGRYEL